MTASCTYEGENTVLQLQVARFLSKMHAQHREQPRHPLPETVAYLARPDLKSVDLDSPSGVAALFAQVAKGHVGAACGRLEAARRRAGVHPADAWNANALELSLVSLSLLM